MSFSPEQQDLARELLALCEARQLRIATAESCTGGLVVACLTEVPGSAAVVTRGFVTYDNEAKAEMLGVPAGMLARVGAVNEEVARAMAEGARDRAKADLAIAITGIAGPTGATATKPVGLVHIAVATADGSRHERHVFAGNRTAVRKASLEAALRLARAAIESA